MNERFEELVGRMPLRLQSLKKQPPIAIDDVGITEVPQKGVYVFFEGNKAIYVGRSNGLKKRLKQHSQRSSHYSATLAFRIAKQDTSNLQKKESTQTKKQLMKNSNFLKEFESAKDRIARTKIRFIEIKEQDEQAIFEIYAVLKLNTTKYNDFDTH